MAKPERGEKRPSTAITEPHPLSVRQPTGGKARRGGVGPEEEEEEVKDRHASGSYSQPDTSPAHPAGGRAGVASRRGAPPFLACVICATEVGAVSRKPPTHRAPRMASTSARPSAEAVSRAEPQTRSASLATASAMAGRRRRRALMNQLLICEDLRQRLCSCQGCRRERAYLGHGEAGLDLQAVLLLLLWVGVAGVCAEPGVEEGGALLWQVAAALAVGAGGVGGRAGPGVVLGLLGQLGSVLGGRVDADVARREGLLGRVDGGGGGQGGEDGGVAGEEAGGEVGRRGGGAAGAGEGRHAAEVAVHVRRGPGA